MAVAVVGGAIIGGVASTQASKGAAETAADAQGSASDASIAEQQRQFNEMKTLMSPYVNAGTPALQQMAAYSNVGPAALNKQSALSGLNGYDAQQSAIAEIESSPLLQSQVAQGEDAILQNASATGGLRGGNTQGALAQYRPQMLQQAIDSQYSKLGGLTNFGAGMTQNLASMGQASATGQANQGMNMATNISNSLTSSGDAQAQAALASGAADAQLYTDMGTGVGTLAGAWGGF